ncbi:MAG: hypothetical protein FJ217_03760 [Ignavibacteria bacterium]|nr:hypothetical protein [Ignavibacteria bacterium]
MRKTRRHEPEYVLHIFHHTDERTQKPVVVFVIRTVKEFTHFNYHILLDAALTGHSIQLKILGLRTSTLIMPGMGPAQGRKDFGQLKGAYHLTVTKLDGESNSFLLNISPNQVTIEGGPPRPFVLAVDEPVLVPED